jgi:hypothetical protein
MKMMFNGLNRPFELSNSRYGHKGWEILCFAKHHSLTLSLSLSIYIYSYIFIYYHVLTCLLLISVPLLDILVLTRCSQARVDIVT